MRLPDAPPGIKGITSIWIPGTVAVVLSPSLSTMSRAVNDINSLRLSLGVGLMNLVQTPLLYLLALGVMATIDWRLTFWVVLPYPLFILIGRAFGKKSPEEH